MKETVERRTCDICLHKQVVRDGEGQIEPYIVSDPRYHWLEIGNVDICPSCAQIIHRASQMGWLADIVAACEGET